MAQVPGSAYQQLLGMVKAPVTPGNLQFVQAWQKAEGGNAAFNPFNTTQPADGATSYNSVGVRNYKDLGQGLSATAQTLVNGHYGKLVSDLRSGKASPMQLAQDVAASPWGTGGGVERVLGSSGGGSSGIPAQAPATKQGASMLGNMLGGGPEVQASASDNLMSLVVQSSAAIASGQPATMNPVVLSQLLSASTGQKDMSSLQSAVAGASAAAQGVPQGVVAAATRYLGVPYAWGGTDPAKGLDCSAFIQRAYGDIGVSIPRTTTDQFRTGIKVDLKDIRPGDAVYTEPGAGPGGGPGHVGLYIGNGTIQESPHTGDVNKDIPLNEFLSGGIVGVRRFTK